MADNPIQFNDLVSESAIEGLQRLIDTIDKLLQQMDGLKSATQQSAQAYAQQVQAIQTDTAAMAEMAVKVASLERGYEDLQKVYEKLKSDKKQIAEEQRKYKKLTEEEADSVRRLTANIDTYIRLTNSEVQSLRGLAEVYGKNIIDIDIQKKSYNELNAIYNALKDSLNKMTVEQRTSTEAGKAMTAQALKIRDTMNELQKSTGNYTLQVGKYRAAFDGLGYSFQQILREAPSALNLNQFFLAISNNIPQFLDQVKAFNDEQKAIKANLATMTEGTKEYAEELGKVMTIGQKITKTLLSWQTLVLVGLLIIRNWDRIVALVQKLFKKIEDGIDSLRRMRQVINEIDMSVENSISKTVVELEELNKRLADVTQGSIEWMNITERIKEIIGESYDLTGKMPDQIQQITQAYIQQAEQLAKNKFVIDKISENADKAFMRERAIETILKTGDIKSAAKIFGYEEGSDQYKALERAANTQMPMPSATDPNAKVWEVVNGKPRRVGYDKFMTDLLNATFDEMEGDLFTQMELEDLWKRYYKPMKTNNNKNGSGKKEFTPADYYWEQQEAIIKATTFGYEQERQLAELNYRRQVAEAQLRLEEDKKAIDENVKNTKEAEYLKQELTKQTDDIIIGYAEERRAALLVIHNKELKDEQDRNEAMRQDRIDADKKDIQALKDKYDEKEKVDKKRRVRTMKDEINNNEKITASIIAMQEHLAELRAMQPREDIEGYNKEVQRLTDSIAKLQTQIDHTRELKGRDLKTILFEGLQDNVGNGTKQSILESILGKDAYEAFKNDNKKLQDAVESDFETWLNTSADAVKEWYSTTLGYIQDLMQAYIDLANAKAEAAAEETEAAKEQYEKEKALMEAGYANRMETAWAEYQEKRELQKKAEADAKQAERNQEILNSAMQASEIATAVAKIYAQFANSPWGIALATALSATMVAAFIAAKSKAIEATKYGDGTAELIQGGSHASGHDVSLAYDSKGRERRVEGGEVFGVINRRAVRRYGADNVMSLINSLNRGTYESHATRLMAMQNELSGGASGVIVGGKTDLRRVESGIDKLVGYSKLKTYTEADGTVVEQHPNGTVRYLKH